MQFILDDYEIARFIYNSATNFYQLLSMILPSKQILCSIAICSSCYESVLIVAPLKSAIS